MPDIHEEPTNLQRDVQPMPDDIRDQLERLRLMEDYRARPAYQQNDYLLWIGQAKQQGTRDKRIVQMLDELREGGVYMGMTHAPSRKD